MRIIDDLQYLWEKIPEGKIVAIAIGLAIFAAIMVIVEKIAILRF